MDYKYIEQLLERYWNCETSLEEEQILRTFFSQKELPAELAMYREIFTSADSNSSNDVLGDDFDARVLAAIDEPATVKARTISIRQRFAPLFKAAAMVAIIVTIVNAAQFSFNKPDNSDDINYANYTDTFNDPEMAYDNIRNALELVSEGMAKAQPEDSTAVNNMSNNTTDEP
ncbi:MAG: hypothetical protein J6B91_02220 [Prevotella sp.]|nr:hypothetical protein [Prevotella sp.]